MSDQELSSVVAVVDRLESSASGKTVTMREAVTALGEASFVPVLLAPALAVVTPMSGIPLFSSICGILIALVSIQMLVNRDHLWLPDWLMRRKVSSDKLKGGIDKMRGIARFLDRITRKRLRFFVARPFEWITEGACFLCGAVMPLLEFVPFTSSLVGAAVVLFSLSLLARDGLFALLGFCVIGAASWTGWTLAT